MHDMESMRQNASPENCRMGGQKKALRLEAEAANIRLFNAAGQVLPGGSQRSARLNVMASKGGKDASASPTSLRSRA